LLNQENLRRTFVIDYSDDFGDTLTGDIIEAKYSPLISKYLKPAFNPIVGSSILFLSPFKLPLHCCPVF
jgi:hypothetical protein